MNGPTLGVFEEQVLLCAASLLGDAYSVAICDEMTSQHGRRVKLGKVHAVLHSLEEKGMVKSQLGEAAKERGGKRKRFYTVTNAGKAALQRIKEQHQEVWSMNPVPILKSI